MDARPTELDDASESNDFFSNFNPLAILLNRWPFLLAGLAVGAILGYLIHVNSPALYEASAQVLVVKKRTEAVKAGDVRIEAVEDYLSTQLTLIRSEKIRLAAARLALQSDLAAAPSDERSIAGMIAGGLTVSRDKEAGAGAGAVGSGVLNLSFRGPNSEDCRKILEAVIMAHKVELFRIYDQANTEKIAQLDKMIGAVEQKREETGEERVDALKELRDQTSEDVVTVRARVSALREQIRTLKNEQIQYEDQLKLIAETGDNPQDRALTLSQLTSQFRFNGTAPTGPGLLPPANPIDAERVAELKVLESKRSSLIDSGVGRDHPRLVAIDAKITDTKRDLERAVRLTTETRPAATKSKIADELTAFTLWLTQKQKTVEKQIRQAESQLKSDEELLKTANGLQDQIDSSTTLIQQYDTELKRIDTEKLNTIATQGSGGYSTESITPPGNGYKIAPVLNRSLITGLGIGLVLGVLTMLLAEVSDQSFRSPADVRRRMGVPVIAHIPLMRPSKAAMANPSPTGLDHVLAAALRPKSVEAEAYRGLRTQLFFSTQGRGHQVIQITSPTPGDGKSSTAANLAISLAQAGKRVILIDCDLRKPRIHKIFGLESPEIGLSSVVAGLGELRQEIQPSGQPNLDLLLCGPRPGNPAELLTSPAFHRVIEELRTQYDFVIVDSPPVLAVVDPLTIAPWIDGVVLVIRMSKKARPNAEQTRERLAGVGAKIMGIALNVADQRTGVYGYGYTYSYKYKEYEYADRYAESASESEGRSPIS
jgi:capsular exopolysaccharide synthesis family protein